MIPSFSQHRLSRLCLAVLYTEGTTSALRSLLTREFPVCLPVTQETKGVGSTAESLGFRVLALHCHTVWATLGKSLPNQVSISSSENEEALASLAQ